MNVNLAHRNILLGVTGSIAAYKSANLLRLLVKEQAKVQVLMTEGATHFITPLTLSTLSGNEAIIDIFPDSSTDAWTKHINLGLWADLFVLAPASAQTIAKLAHGFCDNMVTAVALAARCPLIVFPAMDHDMYIHPATQSNLETLRSHGYRVVEAEHGELASGLTGLGRLPEPTSILQTLYGFFEEEDKKKETPETVLTGKKVLISAGPTREPIDPIRFISNHSTGTMGFELATEAHRLGADVVLVSGPTHLPTPKGVTRIDVVTTADMAAAVFQHRDADLIIMAAAVGDYKPSSVSDEKIKKAEGSLTLSLERTTDILAGLGQSKRSNQTLVGFALETENIHDNAKRKLVKKNLDWIVLNSPRDEGAGFGTSTNKVTLYGADGSHESFPLMSKKEVAQALFRRIKNPPGL